MSYLSSETPDVHWARTPAARAVRAALQAVLLVPLIRVVAPVRVVNKERSKQIDRPVVFIANHQSHLDVPVTLTALGSRLRRRLVIAAAADYFYRNRLSGWAVSLALGTMPFVRRAGSSRPSLELLKGLLRQGWSVLIFPSGSRGDQRSLKMGFSFLAVDTGTPVVPLYLHGLKDSLPKGSFVPLPGGVVVGIGEAIEPGESYEALVEKAQLAFSDLNRIVLDHTAGWGETTPTDDD